MNATEALARVAPPRVWRSVGAFAAAAICVSTASGGLFYLAPQVQAGFVGGGCAALIAPSPVASAAVAAAATFLGMAAGPLPLWGKAPSLGAKLAGAGLAALIAGVVAFCAATALRKAPGAARVMVWAIVGLLVANVWVTALYGGSQSATLWDGKQYLSLHQALTRPTVSTVAVGDVGDQYPYLQVLSAVKSGGSYYQAWHDYLGPARQVGGSAGSSVVNYNLPTRFLLWAALPGSSMSVVYAYLVLASLAVLAVPIAVRGIVRVPLALPGAAAVASYVFVYGYSTAILTGEPWAGLLSVLTVAVWARSACSSRWRAWTVAAVVLGVAAPLFREPAVLVPVAGLAASLLAPGRQRPFRVVAWASGLAVFAALYLAHYVNARPLLSGPTVGAVLRVSGIKTVISALTYGTPALGLSSTLPLLLASLGFLGMWSFAKRPAGTLPALIAGLSMLAYLFVSNGARDLYTGDPVNYWGIIIVPTIYLCIPAAFALLPAMSSPASALPAGGGQDAPPEPEAPRLSARPKAGLG